jgi:hypothetical protein
MTEQDVRGVLWVRAHDEALAAGVPSAHWSRDDAAWATQQALAALGEAAGPESFVRARAAAAMGRLAPREPRGAAWVQAPLSQRGWIVAALLLGAAAGLAIDQLGPPQRVNLLAPALWAVVLWNLAVVVVSMLASAVPTPAPSGWAALLHRLAGAGAELLGRVGDDRERPMALRDAQSRWLGLASPLLAARGAFVLHLAAAALGAGLIAGLYLRGLALDYRAGWQSTFLDAPAVQTVLGALLAPASALTGIAVPDVAPLRVGPDGTASVGAAPWIHLLAATLTLAVLLPRAVLALLAWRRGRRLERDFPLPLADRCFEGLHPLMRNGAPTAVRLDWLDLSATGIGLFGQPPPEAGAPRVLIDTGEGERLELHRADDAGRAAASPAMRSSAAPAWRRWLGLASAMRPPAPAQPPADALLLVATPAIERPAWLSGQALPLVWLVDGDDPVPQPTAPTVLPLHARDDGWLVESRLLDALRAALPGDTRIERLAAHWRMQQAERAQRLLAATARALASAALARETLPGGGGLLGRRGEAEAARAALQARLSEAETALDDELAEVLGRLLVLPPAALPATVPDGELAARNDHPGSTAPALGAALHRRVGEGRAALLGGALGGALVGLKADLATGGLTLGTGALAGGVIGALGAAGAARGLNIVRGTEHSHVDWDDAALLAIAESALTRTLVFAWRPAGLSVAEQVALSSALMREQPRLALLWRSHREPVTGSSPSKQPELAAALQRPMADLMRATLGGPVLAGT